MIELLKLGGALLIVWFATPLIVAALTMLFSGDFDS